MSDEKKYHSSSLSFYQKDSALAEVSNRARLGFDNFQRYEKIVKPRSIELFQKFSAENKKGQQDLLAEESDAYLEAFFQIVKNINSNRELMEYLLPTIDSILMEEPKVLRELISGMLETSNTGILTQLKSILAVEGHEPAAYDAAARIVCIILGELPRRGNYLIEQKNFILELLNLRK